MSKLFSRVNVVLLLVHLVATLVGFAMIPVDKQLFLRTVTCKMWSIGSLRAIGS